MRHIAGFSTVFDGSIASIPRRTEVDDWLFTGTVCMAKSGLGRDGVALAESRRGIDDDLLLLSNSIEQTVPETLTCLVGRRPLYILSRRSTLPLIIIEGVEFRKRECAHWVGTVGLVLWDVSTAVAECVDGSPEVLVARILGFRGDDPLLERDDLERIEAVHPLAVDSSVVNLCEARTALRLRPTRIEIEATVAPFVGDGRPEVDVRRSGVLDGVEYVLDVGRSLDVGEFGLRQVGRAFEFVRPITGSGGTCRVESTWMDGDDVVDDALDISLDVLVPGMWSPVTVVYR